MAQIEKHDQAADEALTPAIKSFWTENVNAERLFGKKVSQYERGSEAYFQDLETQRYRTHTHILPFIASMEPYKTVLEIGCGVGMDTKKLVEQGLSVTAVDLTEVAIETAKSRMPDGNVDFQVADACNLPFAENSFDYVYSFGVLHHAADTEKTIKETHRVLKPGGEARIMLYHRHSLNEWVHRLTGIPFEEKDAECPVVRRFTREEIHKLFQDFDSVSIDIEYVFGEGYGLVYRLTPNALHQWLSKRWGWHLMISAQKLCAS